MIPLGPHRGPLAQAEAPILFWQKLDVGFEVWSGLGYNHAFCNDQCYTFGKVLGLSWLTFWMGTGDCKEWIFHPPIIYLWDGSGAPGSHFGWAAVIARRNASIQQHTRFAITSSVCSRSNHHLFNNHQLVLQSPFRSFRPLGCQNGCFHPIRKHEVDSKKENGLNVWKHEKPL